MPSCDSASSMLFDTVNPDNTVLGIHLFGEIVEQVFIHIQVLSDLGEGCDCVDLVPLHQAASSSS